MRILLASAPHRDTFGYSMPPPGLLRLGGWLAREGVDVALEDLAQRLAAGDLDGGDGLVDDAARLLLGRGPQDAIGLSVMGATLPAGLAILERLRARAPDVALWLGGPGTTGLDATLIERFPYVDAVVRGEGEITLSALCAARAAGRAPAGIAGVTWRAPDGRTVREPDRPPIADLGVLAPYAWDLVPSIAEYKRSAGAEDGLVPLDSGRGCAYDCSFCTIGRFWSRRSRVLPAPHLADEVEALARLPGARAAYLCHDLFGAHRGHALAFCAELLERGVRLPWEVRARADHLDRELLELMAEAGCYRVLLGVESADAGVRERCNKDLRPGTDPLRVVEDCLAVGITPILSLILGLPGEDERALRATLDFCAAAVLRGGVNLSLHLVNPQPGCGLGDELGAAARPLEGVAPDMALGAGETAPERALIAAHPDVFSTFALLPGRDAHLRDLARIAATLPETLQRYPRTFALLAQRERCDAHDLYRTWRAHGRSFEAFARSAGDPLVDDVLALEQALVRAAARGPDTRPAGPRSRAHVVRLRHDVPAALVALRAGEPAPRIERETWVAALPGDPRRPLAGVRTLRLGADVARVLALVDGTRTRAELAAAHPGIEAALDRLAAAGLVEPEDGAPASAREVNA